MRARRWAVAALVLLAVLGADLLASDLPLAVSVDGATYVFPCVFRPAALHVETTRTLRSRASWLVATPVPYGPLETAGSTMEEGDGPPPWAPSRSHWLGSDELGRDVLARLIHGARVSLLVALGTVLLSLVVGFILGSLAALRGGWVDTLISRAIELMSTFPTLFFLIAVFSVVRAASLPTLVVLLGLTRWADIARLTRSEVLRLRSLDYTRAARAMGASTWWVMRRHIVPNAMGPVLVSATFAVSTTLLLEASLTFMGIGVAPPTASWGELLLEAHRNLLQTWSMVARAVSRCGARVDRAWCQRFR